MLAQRDFPPMFRIMIVPDTEPPTGMPPTRPTARLPAPCPRKSPDGSGNSPSGLGMLPLTPAACTKAMTAMVRAGSSIAGTRDSSGRLRFGSERRISVVLPTMATVCGSSTATKAVVSNTATKKLYFLKRVRSTPKMSTMVSRPTASVARSISCQCRIVSIVRATLFPASL